MLSNNRKHLKTFTRFYNVRHVLTNEGLKLCRTIYSEKSQKLFVRLLKHTRKHSFIFKNENAFISRYRHDFCILSKSENLRNLVRTKLCSPLLGQIKFNSIQEKQLQIGSRLACKFLMYEWADWCNSITTICKFS